MRIVAVPAARYYTDRISVERVRPDAVKAFDAIVEAMTRPITADEAKPRPIKVLEPTTKITGENYELALEKFNQVFVDNHWSDGLPLVAPTAARVKWMLTGTSRTPKEIIGTVPPKNGTATIEKIAINAVMAGARPEYLPVIIAAVEGLTDKNYDALHFLTSSGSFNLVIAVSGPIAKEINMNSGIGYWGYGWRANSTIGRAVRLSMINLGHLWPAENDMALVGRPSSHTFYVLAENQDESPWPPYHVGQGFKAEESCVTVSTVGGYGANAVTQYGGGAVGVWSAEAVLKGIIDEIRSDRGLVSRSQIFGSSGEAGAAGAAATLGTSARKHLLLLIPEMVQELNRLGYTRESLQKYISEQTSVPYEDLKPSELKSLQTAMETGIIPPDRVPAFKEALKPGGRVPILIRPEDAHIIVVGGIPGYSLTLSYERKPPYAPTAHQTKLIWGATLTKAGRGKTPGEP